MTKREYGMRLRKKMEQYPKNEYLKYLRLHYDDADYTSKICIQIPAYKDPELMDTIRSCIVTAVCPERLTFAVCYQDDDLKILEELKKIRRMKIKYYAAKDAPGLCAARYDCNQMVDDEDYVLHIDSHMRFSMFWDVGLIQQWRDCDDKKAIVSCYCQDYADTLDNESLVLDEYLPNNTNGKFVNATHFADMTVKLRFVADKPFEPHTSKPRRGAFIGGHFVFGRSEIDKNVPSDPDMYFVADEISMAARYFTNGYNVYQPAYRMVRHLFGRTGNMKSKLGVTIERFNSSKAVKVTDDRERMEKLFRVADHENIDLTGFDIGTERSFDKFLKFAGLDFNEKVILNFAHHGAFDVEHTALDLEPSNWFAKHPHEKKLMMAMKGQHKSILVLILEYKDPHLLDTIKYFKENATYPERIRFAICVQNNDTAVREALEIRDDCKVIYVNPDEARGVGYCYQQLVDNCVDNEDYALITESHMYAVKGWDTYYTNMIDLLGDNAVISNWACGFDYNNLPKDPKQGVMTGIGDINNDRLLCIHYGNRIESKYPVRGCAVIGNNIFGKLRFLKDCRYDPAMRMNLSETAMTLQLWTHGYDVYHTPQRYLYHYYVPSVDQAKDGADKTRANGRNKLRDLERKYGVPKLKRYLGLNMDSEDVIDGDDFLPGTVRSVMAFELFAGVDFTSRRISRRAYTGHFTADTYVDQGYIDKKYLDDYCKDHNFDARMIGEMETQNLRNNIPGIRYERA